MLNGSNLWTFFVVGIGWLVTSHGLAQQDEQPIPEIKRYSTDDTTIAGSCPRISPNGRFVAIRRYVPEERLIRGGPDPFAESYRRDVWVYDLESKTEKLLSKNCADFRWMPNDKLELSTLQIVDPSTGKKLEDVPKSTKVRFSSRDKLKIGNDAIVQLNDSVVGDILSSHKGASWLSPDSRFVAFDFLFPRRGNVPIHRIGVADVGQGNSIYVGESAYCHYNWGYQAQQMLQCLTNPWSSDSKHFVFVSGRGDGEADLYICNSSGSKVMRMTDDGDCKWSPVFDPTNRRLAYFAGTWGGENGTIKDVHVRVLDIYTGAEHRLAPEDAEGYGHAIAWGTDGEFILHDWYQGERVLDLNRDCKIFRVNLPKSQPVSEGSNINSIPDKSLEDRVVAALKSDSGTMVSWGVERANQVSVEPIQEAILEALPKWFPVEHPCASEMLMTLIRIDAQGSAPALQKMILLKPSEGKVPGNSQSNATCIAIGALVDWETRSAKDDLRKYLLIFPDDQAAVYATAALVAFGDDRRWHELSAYSKSTDKWFRSRLIRTLKWKQLREPRGTNILIDLLSDDECLYLSIDGDTNVGDEAYNALKEVTGEDFGREPAKWRTWFDTTNKK